MGNIEISLIGGEPLLEYELLKNIFEYTHHKYSKENIIFFHQQMEHCLLMK
jgi:uncharacterized protein